METNLDNRLLLRAQTEEIERAESLQAEQMQARRQSEHAALKKGMAALGRVAEDHSITTALKEGVDYGLYLRAQIKENELTGGIFIVLLSLSIIKDLVDFSGIAFLNPFNLFLITVLFLARAGKGKVFRRIFVKRYLIFLGFDNVPGISFFPLTTIGTIMVKQGLDEEIRKMKNELKAVEKAMASGA